MSKKIYLMRHSIPEKIKIETSMIPLSDEGRALAKSKKEVMKRVDHCFSSSYKRAIDTAKIITDNVVVVSELHERIIGEAFEDFWLKQYLDHDYRNPNGESLNDVKNRMKIAIDSILGKIQDGESALIVSHATAICSYLLNYCNVTVTNPSDKSRKITYKDETVMDGIFAPTNYFEIDFINDSIDSICFHS